MRELSLHLLDIAENSISAKASRVSIQVLEDYPADRLELSVRDNGIGMSPELAAQVLDPFVTSRTERKVGLGLPLLKQAAEACGGILSLNSTPGLGTEISAAFQRSHWDRMPLGDLGATYLHLLVAHPEVNWRFGYRLVPVEPKNVQPESLDFLLDDRELKEILGDVPLSEPEVLAYLRDLFAPVTAAIMQTQGIFPNFLA